MNYNQNQEFNQQFNYNFTDQFSQNQNAQNMQVPINQQNLQITQQQQNQQQQQFQQYPPIPSAQPYGQQQPQMVFDPVQVDFNNNMVYQQQQQQPGMQQPYMPNQNLQQPQMQQQGGMTNFYQTHKLIDPNATETELQYELSLLQDNVQNIQKANLILDIKNYLIKQNYRKPISKNVAYCIKALGMMKGPNSEAALNEVKKKFDADTDCLFSGVGDCFICLTIFCCLCCFMMCFLQCCRSCGNCLPSNWQQVQEIKQLIDKNIALCNQTQQIQQI